MQIASIAYNNAANTSIKITMTDGSLAFTTVDLADADTREAVEAYLAGGGQVAAFVPPPPAAGPPAS